MAASFIASAAADAWEPRRCGGRMAAGRTRREAPARQPERLKHMLRIRWPGQAAQGGGTAASVQRDRWGWRAGGAHRRRTTWDDTGACAGAPRPRPGGLGGPCAGTAGARAPRVLRCCLGQLSSPPPPRTLQAPTAAAASDSAVVLSPSGGRKQVSVSLTPSPLTASTSRWRWTTCTALAQRGPT